MTIDRHLSLVEEILDTFKDTIGADFLAYKNHVYRVVNLCYAAGVFGAEDKEKIQIAACFHDLGIWTDATLDYLTPSEEAAATYLAAVGRKAWTTEVTQMIEMHHRLRSCKSLTYPLVEAFRRADVADFSLGLFRMGLPKDLILTLKSDFPNSGFHKRLLQLGQGWLIAHPRNPFSMFRV